VTVAVVEVDVNDTITTAVRGSNVILDCIDNVNVTWSFENTALSLTDEPTVIANNSLLIRSVDIDDMGDYTCEAGDVIIIQHSLIVTAAPEITLSPRGNCLNPGTLFLDSRTDVVLMCTGFGIPAPTVSWSFQGTLIVCQYMQ